MIAVIVFTPVYKMKTYFLKVKVNLIHILLKMQQCTLLQKCSGIIRARVPSQQFFFDYFFGTLSPFFRKIASMLCTRLFQARIRKTVC